MKRRVLIKRKDKHKQHYWKNRSSFLVKPRRKYAKQLERLKDESDPGTQEEPLFRDLYDVSTDFEHFGEREDYAVEDLEDKEYAESEKRAAKKRVKNARLIVEGGKVKGAIQTKRTPPIEYMENLVLLPKERRKGLGTKTVENLKKDKEIGALTGQSTINAIPFWRKQGAKNIMFLRRGQKEPKELQPSGHQITPFKITKMVTDEEADIIYKATEKHKKKKPIW